MAIVIGVRFAKNSKIYYFDPSDVWPAIGDGVICDTSRGPEYGVVAASAREVEDDMLQLPLRKVLAMATEADVERVHANEKLGREAMLVCKDKIVEHKLEMKLIDVEVAFDNSKMVFYFTANGRVDFRELVKDLAAVFKTRIELRQIGVRDEAKLLGGLGPCGRPICCGSFLSNFQPVSIKMAKEQNLSLNPTKISGLCGRLMCCLKYEEDYYEMMTKRLPRTGRDIMTPDGLGTVVDIDVLREKVKARIQLPDNTFDVRTYEYADCSRPEPGQRPEQNARPEQSPRAAQQDAKPQPEGREQREERRKNRQADEGQRAEQPKRERRRKQSAQQAAEAVEAAPVQENAAGQPAPELDEADMRLDMALDVTDMSFDDDMLDMGVDDEIDEELRAERELLAIAHAQNAAAEARYANMTEAVEKAVEELDEDYQADEYGADAEDDGYVGGAYEVEAELDMEDAVAAAEEADADEVADAADDAKAQSELDASGDGGIDVAEQESAEAEAMPKARMATESAVSEARHA